MLRVPVRSNLTRQEAGSVAADGTLVIPLSPQGSADAMVRQVTVEMSTAPVGATCTLRLNGALVSTALPFGDSIVEPPPVLVTPGDSFTVEWASCTPGDAGRVLMIYDEVVPR